MTKAVNKTYIRKAMPPIYHAPISDKALFNIALISLMICFAWGARAFALCGDLNGDGVVSSLDTQIAAQAAIGQVKLTAEQSAAADCAVSGQAQTPDRKILSNDMSMISEAALGNVILACNEGGASISGTVSTPPKIVLAGAGQKPARIDVYRIDDNGNKTGQALQAATVGAGGAFAFTLGQDAGPCSALIAAVGGGDNRMRAILFGASVNINPISEWVASEIIASPLPLANFAPSEIANIVSRAEAVASGIDVSSAATVADAVSIYGNSPAAAEIRALIASAGADQTNAAPAGTFFTAVPTDKIREVSGRRYVASQLVLKGADNTSYADVKAAVEQAGASVTGYNPELGIYQVQLPDGMDEAQASALLAGKPQVKAVARHPVLSPGSYVPNDPPWTAGTPEQKKAFEIVHAPQVWSQGQLNNHPVIAVLDTGVNVSLPDFSGRVTGGADFIDPAGSGYTQDAAGHGTLVAGIAAAAGDNGSGMAGICWGCRVMPVRVCDGGSCPFFAVLNGIVFAADNHADIINLSVEGAAVPGSPEWEIFQNVIDYAAKRGVFISAAAGNDGTDAGQIYPAALNGVFAAGATDNSDAPAAFSNGGSAVDLYAPGVAVYSLLTGGGAGPANGTSMSAAFVSGAAGLIKSYRPSISPAEIDQLLKSNSDPLPSAPSPAAGRLNLELALKSFMSATDTPPAIDSMTFSANSVELNQSVAISVAAHDADNDQLTYIWEMTGGSLTGASQNEKIWTSANLRGEFIIKVTVSDGRGGSVSREGTVSAGLNGMLSMDVFPRFAQVNQGGIANFDAYGLFADGNTIKIQPVWGTPGNKPGVISADGIFSALSAGTGNVTASAGGLSATSPVAAGVSFPPPPLKTAGMTANPTFFALDPDTVSMVVGDVNGDGRNDVIAITGNNKTSKIYQNNGGAGNVNFSLLGALPTAMYGTTGALGDIDADGDLDLVIGDSNNGGMKVFTNNGSGSFTLSQTLEAGNSVYYVRFHDMNNDGQLDIVSGPTNVNKPKIYWNNGSGSFTTSTTLNTFSDCGIQYPLPGDVNNDGWPDVVRTCRSPGVLHETVLNSGTGTFPGAAVSIAGTNTYLSPFGYLANITAGDDNMDYVIIDRSANSFRTFTGNGNGTFAAGSTFDSMPPGAGSNQFDMADTEDDGDVDLISAPNSTDMNKLWKNNGSGTFSNVPADQFADNVSAAVLGDIESDGDADLLVMAPPNNSAWLSNAGNPMNQAPPSNLSIVVSSPNVYHLQWDLASVSITPRELMTFDVRMLFFDGTATRTVISGIAPEREGVIGHATRTVNTYGYTVKSPPISGAGVLSWAVRAVDTQFHRSNWSATSTTYLCPLVSSAADTGAGTLRDCISNYANTHPNTAITFSGVIAGQTITAATAMPTITGAGTRIDGGTNNITLDGTGCANCTGLTITANNATIKSLTIKNFKTNGIYVQTGTGTTIGGATAASRNIITGNGDAVAEAGIRVGAGAAGVTIRNNYIGLAADGDTASANYNGIRLESSSFVFPPANIVRDNVISGNTNYGVYDANYGLTYPGTEYLSNIIGLNAAGTTGRANKYGIYAASADQLEVGLPGGGNTISCNTTYGLYIDTASVATVQANMFGTTSTGGAKATCPAGAQGINIYTTNNSASIGGLRSTGEGNIICCAGQYGIQLKSVSSSSVVGNYIGTGVTGTESTFGNGIYGIFISGGCDSVSIGDSSANDPDLGNVIAYNTTAGIFVGGAPAPFGDSLLNNSIYSNGTAADKGIKLSAGAHGGITAPSVSNAVCAGANSFGPYDITVSYNSTSGNPSTVFLYRADNTPGPPLVATDTVGGEGYEYLAQMSDSGGLGPLTLTFTNVSVSNGQWVSAYRFNPGDPYPSPGQGFSEFGTDYKLPSCVGNPCPVVNDIGDSGDGTLRDCMDRANTDGIPTNITFTVGGAINLASALPALIEPGTTINGGGTITVNGGGAVADGISIATSSTVIKNLRLVNFASSAIYISGPAAQGNSIEGNLIGFNAANVAQPNRFGITISGGATGNTIGGAFSAQDNVISGNSDSGIFITGASTANNVIRGNMIGTFFGGLTTIPNGTGVKLTYGAHNNTIGWPSGDPNLIDYNTGNGIDASGAATSFNTFRQNSTHDNGGKGIRLDGAGSNNNIQPPTITGATYDGATYAFTGTLNCPAFPCRVELFRVDDTSVPITEDPAHAGEGFEFIASANVAAGTAFSFTNLTINTNGTKVTSTLTDSTGNTSEFSANVNLPPPNNPPVVSGVTFNPDNIWANGIDTSFATATVTDPQGSADIATVTINLSLIGRSSTFPMYDDGAHNDGMAGDGLYGSAAFTAVAGTAPNSYTITVTAGDTQHATGTADGVLTINGSTCPIVRSTADSGINTLRQCIIDANSGAAGKNITFNTSINGQTITLASALPAITTPNASIMNLAGRSVTISGNNGAFDCITAQSATNTFSRLAVIRCGTPGSQFAGIHITGAGASGNSIIGSYIGTDSALTAGMGNGVGVRMSAGAHDNLVDGTTGVHQSVIAGNTNHGIMIGDAGTYNNIVRANYIGTTDIAGSASLPNTGNGIYIYNGAANTKIGSAAAGDSNTIAHNGGDGIQVNGAATWYNKSSRNRIHSNGGLGINLVAAGANKDILPPTVTSFVNNGSDYTMQGTVACLSYPCTVEMFYADDSPAGVTADPSGAGEGFDFATSAAIAAGVNFSFSNFTVPPTTSKVTLTLTDNNGNTSEFSADRNLPPFNFPPTVSSMAFNPATIPGDGVTPTAVTVSVNDQNGYADISSVTIDITQIGGTAAFTMYDDGHHNDGAAGDNVFGATFTAQFDQACATYTLTVTARDSQGAIGTAGNGLGVTCTSCPVVSNPFDPGILGTLRDCINRANNDHVPTNITFDPTLAGQTIALSSALPALTENTTSISNTTGAEISISGGGAAINCFTINSANNTISGLSIIRCGTLGAQMAGIYISGAGATGNAIKGNYIGTSRASVSGLGDSYGVYITGGATNNSVDGSTASGLNVISGNLNYGVYLGGSNNTVKSSYIGTNAAGSAAVGNAGGGIFIAAGANGNTIGGSAANAMNVISGNGIGVLIQSASNNVFGNYIGVNATASVKVGNQIGVQVTNSGSLNSIGGFNAGEGNIIGGNTTAGVDLFTGASANKVYGNIMGTSASATATPDLGNAIGLQISNGAAGNIAGGATAGQPNRIVNSTNQGIRIDAAATVRNTLSRNTIYNSGLLGIDLLNNSQNSIIPPNITKVINTAGVYQVFATVPGPSPAACSAAKPCAVEIFGADGPAAAADVPAGEAYQYATQTVINSCAATPCSTIISNLPSFAPSTIITATVTDGNGNTSEFANNYTLPPPNFPPVISNIQFTPSVILAGVDTTVLTATVTDANGAADISSVWADFSAIPDATPTINMTPIGGGVYRITGITVPGTTASATYAVTIYAADSSFATGTAIGSLIVTGDSCPIVSRTNDSGKSTLRQCIIYANANPGTSITFDNSIANQTLSPASALPAVTALGTTIDGGAANVTISGAACGALCDGFVISNTNNATVKSLTISNFQNNGILVSGSANTTIGGAAASARNVIINNGNTATEAGIRINLAGGASSGFTIRNNYIGVRADGGTAGANQNGVYITCAAKLTADKGTIRDNVISGNANSGVYDLCQHVDAVSGVLYVKNNIVGLNATGSFAVANNNGLSLFGNNYTVGAPSDGNTVSCNTLIGLTISNIDVVDPRNGRFLVQGNRLGTDITGTSNPCPNVQDFGVYVNGAHYAGTIGGGRAASEGNTISGASDSGIKVDGASQIFIEGNAVGTNFATGTFPAGTVSLPNANFGIRLAAMSGQAVIGDAAGAADFANTIAYNGLGGIYVENGSSANQLTDDSIYNNGGAAQKGIILAAGGHSNITPLTMTDVSCGSANGLYNVTLAYNNPAAYGVSQIYLYRADNTPGPPLAATDTVGGEGFAFIANTAGAAGAGAFTASFTDLPITTANGRWLSAYRYVAPLGFSEFSNDMQAPTCMNTCPVVSSIADAGPGTLRQCIQDANAAPGTTITFDPAIFGSTIKPHTQLPDITANATVVDGAGAGINLNGSYPCANCHGLVINNAANVQIKNLTLTRFDGAACDGGANKCAGISVKGAGATGDVVKQNIIGTNNADSTALRNQIGVLISNGAGNNTVGGTAAADRNVISNNIAAGISITGAGTDGNKIYSNYIGTNNAGALPLTAAPMQASGISIDNGAKNTVVGSTAAQKNVLAGSQTEISITGPGSDGTIIQNNYIGTNAAGSVSLVSSGTGISVNQALNTVIGGDSALQQGNTITGAPAAARYGIKITSSTGTTVRGNNIGVLANGTAGGGAPAGSVGIMLQSDTGTIIGGSAAGFRNVIGANPGYGIRADASANPVVQNNYIGTNVAGTAVLANGTGIFLDNGTHNADIGGTNAGELNTIVNNTNNGISASGAGTDFNKWTRNLIYRSGGAAAKGIILDGIANQGISKPAISFISQTATDTFNITGTSACLNCTIELFRADDTASGVAQDTVAGEAFQYLTTATTNAGTGAWSVAGLTVTGGKWVTATVTRADGNSSEFADNKQATNIAPVVVSVTFTPASVMPDGVSQFLINAFVTDANGSTDIRKVDINLSPVNPSLGTVTLWDTGVPGAGVANDGLFGIYATASNGIAPGAYTLTVTAYDIPGLTGQGTQSLHIDNATSTISGSSVTPGTVVPGFFPVTFKVTVADMNGLSDISSVKIDLSPIGGSAAQSLFDDGAHADGAASDGVYALNNFTIPAAAPFGSSTITITVKDTSGAVATTTFIIYVNRPSTIVNMQFSPSSVTANGSSTTTATIQVADPESLSDVTSVTVDMSSVGIPAVLQLLDDGLNNDGAANDGIFGRKNIIVAQSWPAATYNPVGTIRDFWGRTVHATAPLTITPSSPKPPVIITFDGASSTAHVSWQSPTLDTNDIPLINLAGHKLYRTLTSGIYAGAPLFVDHTTATGTVISYTDGTVSDFSNYCYVATAFDTAGHESGYSNEVCVTVMPPAWVYKNTCGDQITGGFQPPGTPGYFNRPTASAGDLIGNYFIADTDNHRIMKFGPNCTFLGARGTFGSGIGQFKNPTGITYNSVTNLLYVVDSTNRVQVFDTTDAMAPQAAKNFAVPGPVGIKASPVDGTLYITTKYSQLRNMSLNGGLIKQWSFNSPRGVDVDGAGNIYVADAIDNKVYKISGGATTSWGSTGSAFNQLLSPMGVAFDPATGFLFVADSDNDRVMVYDTNGALKNVIGHTGANYGELRKPTGVHVTVGGNIIVSDRYNNRVEVFVPPGH